jgi:hypothetical protein
METQVSLGVPYTQSRMWSHALLAADSALLMPRICTATGEAILMHQPCSWIFANGLFPQDSFKSLTCKTSLAEGYKHESFVKSDSESH